LSIVGFALRQRSTGRSRSDESFENWFYRLSSTKAGSRDYQYRSTGKSTSKIYLHNESAVSQGLEIYIKNWMDVNFSFIRERLGQV
jgi:hypothetical protein